MIKIKKKIILKVKFGFDPNSSGPGGPAQLFIWLFCLPLVYLILSIITPHLLLLTSFYDKKKEKIKAGGIAVAIGIIPLLCAAVLTHISLLNWDPFYGVPYPSFEYVIWEIWLPLSLLILIPYIIASLINYFIIQKRENFNWKFLSLIYFAIFFVTLWFYIQI